MKCPKCGFVSHPGLLQCKKCGRQFAPAPRKESPSFISSLLSPAPKETPAASTRPPPASKFPPLEAPGRFNPPSLVTPERPPATVFSNPGGLPADAHLDPRSASPMWRDELTGRVQKFRRKRARLRGGFDPNSTLDLEFDSNENDSSEELASLIGGQVIEFGEPDVGFSPVSDSWTEEESVIDSLPEVPAGAGLRVLSGAAVQVGEMPLGQMDAPPDRVEIILDSGHSPEQATALPERSSLHARDLMSRRILAGLVDATVLVVGGGVFAATFWAVALKTARISPLPANLIALGAVAALLMIFYFGMSVTLSAATPGLAWMGLEVRNLDGDLPTPREAWWRAFGYLVSASAMFLGFVWALLDSDGLAWHDLMSGTYVTERDS